jgi:probable rRNA maturation factor
MVNNEIASSISESRLATTVRRVLEDHGINHGEVSVAVVDDQTIHGLNRAHLEHDYPTDVLSFLLERTSSYLEGEIVVSWDTACRSAGEYGWSSTSELILYVVHGALHLVGYEDHTEDDRALMRQQEAKYLRLADVGLSAQEPST